MAAPIDMLRMKNPGVASLNVTYDASPVTDSGTVYGPSSTQTVSTAALIVTANAGGKVLLQLNFYAEHPELSGSFTHTVMLQYRLLGAGGWTNGPSFSGDSFGEYVDDGGGGQLYQASAFLFWSAQTLTGLTAGADYEFQLIYTAPAITGGYLIPNFGLEATAVVVKQPRTSHAVTFVGKSATIQSGIGAVTPAYPAGTAADDLAFLVVHTNNQNFSLTANATGWNLLGTVTDTGGNDQRTTVMYRWLTGADAAPTVGDSGDHQHAYIAVWRGVMRGTGAASTTFLHGQVAQFYNAAGAATSWTHLGPTTRDDNIPLLLFYGVNLPDASGSSQFTSLTSAGLANITEQVDFTGTSGFGGGMGLFTADQLATGQLSNLVLVTVTSSNKTLLGVALEPAV